MTRLRRVGLEPGVGLLALLIALIVLPPALPAATRVIAWGTNNFGQLEVPAGLTNVIAVATSPYAAIALTAEGRLVPWGDNRNGQLNLPEGLPPVSAVALGLTHGNVLLPDSTVLGWGSGQGAQVPFGLTNVVALAANGSRSVAVKADGTVVSWGDSYPVPTDATNIVEVACGSSHTLGLRADGTVIAWGSNHFGESSVPPGLSNIVKIAAGSLLSLALEVDGTLHVWGLGATGANQPPPDVTHWADIAGNGFNLGLLTNGMVRAWGSVEPMFTTVPSSVTNAMAVAGGGGFGLALLGDGQPYLWKSPTDLTVFSGAPARFEVKALGTAPVRYQWRQGNTDLPGETKPVLPIAAAQTSQAGTYRVVVTDSLGVSTSEPATLTVLESPPVILAQPTNRVALAGRPFNLQVEVEGSLPITYEWRRNGTAVPGVSGPVFSRTNAVYLDAGDYEVVMANAFGSRTSAVARVDFVPVAAWGFPSWVPESLTNVVDVLAGSGYVVALRADGTVTNWGGGNLPGTHTAGMSNIVELIRGSGGTIAGLTARGEIQFAQPPTFSQESLGFVPATALPAASAVKGDLHFTAINAHGRAVSWGNNTYGQTNVPPHATNLVALAAGYHHTLALRADGQLVTWGRNNAGQLNLPEGATNIVAVWSGAEHSYARRADGTLFSWGAGAQMPPTSAPVAGMSVGESHTLVLHEDGATSGWTWNSFAYHFPHVFPTGLTNFIALSAGFNQSAALVGPPQPRARAISGTLSLYSGETLLLRANAAGLPPLRYQWRRNGLELSGATNFYFSVPAAEAGRGGQYDVVVWNTHGTNASPLSSVAVVETKPLLTSHPTNQVRLFHGTAHFSAGVTGSKPVHLQWQRNGVDLPGETNLSLTVPGLRFAQAGTYRLMASNAFGGALSDPAELAVMPVALFGDQNLPAFSFNPLGTGLTNPPIRVTNAVQIAAGGHHLLAILDDGSPLAWGSNENGQLEIPTGLPPFTTLDGGGWHSVGLLQTGEMVAWGLFLNTRQAEPNLLDFSAASTGVSMLYGDGGIKDVAYTGAAVSHAPPRSGTEPPWEMVPLPA